MVLVGLCVLFCVCIRPTCPWLVTGVTALCWRQSHETGRSPAVCGTVSMYGGVNCLYFHSFSGFHSQKEKNDNKKIARFTKTQTKVEDLEVSD